MDPLFKVLEYDKILSENVHFKFRKKEASSLGQILFIFCIHDHKCQ